MVLDLRSLAVAAVLAVGCGDDSGEPAASEGSQTSGDDSTEGDNPVTDDGPGSTGWMDTGPGDTGPGDTTAGGPEICEISDGDAPGFTLRQGTTPVPTSDALLEVSCGGQGAFMFYLPVEVVGVDPGGTDEVPFTFTIDVDGMNAVEGEHFIDRNVDLYVGCEQNDGGVNLSNFNIVLPDPVTAPEALDGLAFSMEVVMMPGTNQEVSFSSQGVIDSAIDNDWDICGSYGDDDDDDDDDDDESTGTDTGAETDGDAEGTSGSTG